MNVFFCFFSKKVYRVIFEGLLLVLLATLEIEWLHTEQGLSEMFD